MGGVGCGRFFKIKGLAFAFVERSTTQLSSQLLWTRVWLMPDPSLAALSQIAASLIVKELMPSFVGADANSRACDLTKSPGDASFCPGE